MRAIIVFVVLALLFVLVRSRVTLDVETTKIFPVLVGYGALFAAGIVAAELLRPALSRLSATSRFVVVAMLGVMVWVGLEAAQRAGKLPVALQIAENGDAAAEPDLVQTRLPLAWDGVFRAVAQINNTSAGVVIDPSTPLVLLTFEEADRLGLVPDRRTFGQRVQVADRKISASETLHVNVRINAIELLDVEAAIAEAGALDTSLVGLSFLRRLQVAAILADELLLRQ